MILNFRLHNNSEYTTALMCNSIFATSLIKMTGKRTNKFYINNEKILLLTMFLLFG